jgi:DNA-binding NtrC family response regulator
VTGGGGGVMISPDHLPAEVSEPLLSRLGATAPPVEATPMQLEVDPMAASPSQRDLERVLRHFGGSVAEVATYFGRDRRQVYRWLKRYEIDPDSFRP